jgi:hypothetical protein
MGIEDKARLAIMLEEIRDKASDFGVRNLQNDYVLNDELFMDDMLLDVDNINSIATIYQWLNDSEEDATISKGA